MNKQSYCYDYPRAAITTDCVVFGFDERGLKVLLIERGIDPFKGKWALPGGFMQMDETADACAKRELEEETGVADLYLEQLYSFSDVDRDPRGRVVTIAYYALVKMDDYQVKGGDDARQAVWFPIHAIPSLAFDHDRILRVALQRLKGKIRYQPIGFALLPKKFTLSALQYLYEAILEMPLDKRNFRKKILKMNFLRQLDEKEQGVARKAAYYYEFDRQNYDRLLETGFHFEI